MAVIDGGKHAVTHYDTLELMAGAALLEVHLETGRTHQIRVHMAAVGHPGKARGPLQEVECADG